MRKSSNSNSYENLVSQWSPESESSRYFALTVVGFVVAFLLLGLVLTVLDAPQRDTRKQSKVPDRIAKFINEKKQGQPPQPTPPPREIPKPMPTPEPELLPEIAPEEKPRIVKKRRDDKALTESQKKAREKAAESGLLAFAEEFADLQNSTAILAKVGGKTRSTGSGALTRVGGDEGGLLDSNIGQGSGGISDAEYQAPTLQAGEVAEMKTAKIDSELLKKRGDTTSDVSSKERRNRAEGDVSKVFDQKKGVLYSLYNRERRKNPGLQGKVVLELKIDPAGNVTAIKIISSELNSVALENRILARVKRFNFGAMNSDTVTVIFPIEFLPS